MMIVQMAFVMAVLLMVFPALVTARNVFAEKKLFL